MTQHHVCLHNQPLVSGLRLYSWSCLLANAWEQTSPGLHCAPSGARIFYYTRLVLLRLKGEPAIDPTTRPLSPSVAAAFLRTAPLVGGNLAAEFQRVAHVLADPVREGTKLLATSPAPQFAGLTELLAAQGGPMSLPAHNLFVRWETCWKALANCPLPALAVLLNPAQALVAPVARPEDSAFVAVRLLKDRLSRDARVRSWHIPPPGVYLYEEPFLHWFARGLLAQPWFPGLWQRSFPEERSA